MTIGTLNGKWEFMLKLSLVAMPFVLTSILSLNVWLVSEAFESRAFRTSGERFTQSDGRELEKRTMENSASVRLLHQDIGAIKEMVKEVKSIINKYLVAMRSIWEWFKRPMSRIEGYLATVAISLGASFLFCMMHTQTLSGPVNTKLDAILNRLESMGSPQQTNNNQVTVTPIDDQVKELAKQILEDEQNALR